MKILQIAVVVSQVLTGASQAFGQGASSDKVPELKAAERRVARSAAEVKGGARQQLEIEQQRLDSLIDDLENGRAVDPAAVDRALKRAENPFS